MKISKAICLTAMCFCLAPLAQIANAQQAATVRVGGWAPTEATYRYKRSDCSAPSVTKSLKLAKANTSVDVSDTWSLGASNAQFKDFKGWIKLTTFTPNKLEKKIDFTLHCK